MKKKFHGKKLCALCSAFVLSVSGFSAGVLAEEDLLTSEPTDVYEEAESGITYETPAMEEDNTGLTEGNLVNSTETDAGNDVSEPAGEQDSVSVPESDETILSNEDLLISDNGEESSDPSDELILPEEDVIEDSDAEEVGSIGTYSGTCGNGLTWKYEDGLLTIRGNGAITSAPWSNFESDCTSYITKVVFENNVTSICESAFKECDKLTSISMGNALQVINKEAFKGCSSLKNISIPGSVMTIEENVFEDCTSLTSITIPNSVTTLNSGVFKNCSVLKTAKLSNKLNTIESEMFFNCFALTSISIPESVTEINHYAFYNCTSLSSLNIPSGVTRLEGYSFSGCTSLKKLYLPENLFFIGQHAFEFDSQISEISMMSKVKFIEEYAFAGCGALTDVYFSGTADQWHGISIGDGNISLTSAFLHYNGSMNVDKPVLSSLTPLTTGVKVSWGMVSGAPKYRVFYRVAGTGTWKKAGDTTATSYNVTGLMGGETYQFAVRCLNAAGTAFVSEIAQSMKMMFIFPPNVNTVTLTADGVTVSWAPVSGAKKYRVFYKVSGASGYTIAGETTSNNYSINGLVSGKTYVFTVRCMNAAATAYTSSYYSIGTSRRYVKAPVITSMKNAANGITVTWGACGGASQYRLYYKESGSSKWIKAGDTASVSYTVKGLTSGKKYDFTARCMNSTGSTYTSAYTNGKSLLCLATPGVKAVKASKGVKVTWNRISGATGYHIYRKVSGGNWVRIKSISSGSTVTFTDTTGKSGTRYYYTVRAYNSGVLGFYNTAGASAIAG